MRLVAAIGLALALLWGATQWGNAASRGGAQRPNIVVTCSAGQRLEVLTSDGRKIVDMVCP